MQTPKEINQNKDIQQLTGLAPSQLLILGILVQLEDSHPRSYFVFFFQLGSLIFLYFCESFCVMSFFTLVFSIMIYFYCPKLSRTNVPENLEPAESFGAAPWFPSTVKLLDRRGVKHIQ